MSVTDYELDIVNRRRVLKGKPRLSTIDAGRILAERRKHGDDFAPVSFLIQYSQSPVPPR